MQKCTFAPQHMSWSTISYLSFIHGVITDVHDRPWVCLGGSVASWRDTGRRSVCYCLTDTMQNLINKMYPECFLKQTV